MPARKRKKNDGCKLLSCIEPRPSPIFWLKHTNQLMIFRLKWLTFLAEFLRDVHRVHRRVRTVLLTHRHQCPVDLIKATDTVTGALTRVTRNIKKIKIQQQFQIRLKNFVRQTSLQTDRHSLPLSCRICSSTEFCLLSFTVSQVHHCVYKYISLSACICVWVCVCVYVCTLSHCVRSCNSSKYKAVFTRFLSLSLSPFCLLFSLRKSLPAFLSLSFSHTTHVSSESNGLCAK